MQKRWITHDAGFTADVSILHSDAFRTATPYNAAFAETLDHLRDFWNEPPYNELLAKATVHLADALDGKATAQQALDALAADHEEIFQDAGLKK